MNRSWLFLGLVVLAGCGGPDAAESEDYVFEGRRLGDWLGAVKGEDAPSRAAAEQALGRLGPENRAAVPALVRATTDPAVPLRLAAVRGLGQIGFHSRDVEHALQKAMVDPDRSVRRAGIRAWARLARRRAQPPPSATRSSGD